MTTTLYSTLLIVIIIGCVGYWFFLKKQISEEEEDRIEPSIDNSFSEFNQNHIAESEHISAIDEQSVQNTSNVEEITEEEVKINPNYELFDETIETEELMDLEPKQSFFARVKEHFSGGNKHDDAVVNTGRPESIRTVALVLVAPENQPYLGKEILEVGNELKLMMGTDGFLQKIVTTYEGDEAMFSVANIVHPGVFNVPDILQMEIPGIILFAHIPGPDPHVNTAQELIKAAAYYGQELGGTLLDENKKPVDSQYIQLLLEEVSELDKQEWAKYR